MNLQADREALIQIEAEELLSRNELAAAEAAHNNAADLKNRMSLRPRGLTIRVIKGRKVKVGTIGECANAGSSQYGEWVIIRTPDGVEQFCNLANIEIIDPEYLAACDAVESTYNVLAEVEARRAAAQKQFRELAIRIAGIDLSVKLDESREQAAYRDYVTFSTPCNPEATDREINRALMLMDPAGNSWGSLRWSCGTKMVEARTNPGMLRLESSTGIAD